MSTYDKAKVVPIDVASETCQTCRLKVFCLGRGLNSAELAAFDSIVTRQRPFRSETCLYRQGDTFEHVYVVRTGSVKSHSLASDGTKHTMDFYLPGDLTGLGAISTGIHPCTAQALETTTACAIPYAKLEELSAVTPGLQRSLVYSISQALHNGERHITMSTCTIT